MSCKATVALLPIGDDIKLKTHRKDVCCTAHFLTNRRYAFLYVLDISSYNRRQERRRKSEKKDFRRREGWGLSLEC